MGEFIALDPGGAEEFLRRMDDVGMSLADLRAYLGSFVNERCLEVDMRPVDGVLEWMGETRRDLQWRIEVMRNHEAAAARAATFDFTGIHFEAPPAPVPAVGPVALPALPSMEMAFAAPEEARRAGAADASRVKDGHPDLAKIAELSEDPVYASAFLSGLGTEGLTGLMREEPLRAAELGIVISNSARSGVLGPAVRGALFVPEHAWELAGLARYLDLPTDLGRQAIAILVPPDATELWEPEMSSRARGALWLLAKDPDLARQIVRERPDLRGRMTSCTLEGGDDGARAAHVLELALATRTGSEEELATAQEGVRQVLDQLAGQKLSDEARRGVASLLAGHLDQLTSMAVDVVVTGEASSPVFGSDGLTGADVLATVTEAFRDPAARAEILAGGGAVLGGWADALAKRVVGRIGDGATAVDVSRAIDDAGHDNDLREAGFAAGCLFKLLGEANQAALDDDVKAAHQTAMAARLVVSGAIGAVGAFAGPAAPAVATGLAKTAADKAAGTLLDSFEEHLAEGARKQAEDTSVTLRKAVTDGVVVAFYNSLGAERAATLGVPTPPRELLDDSGHLRIPLGDDAASLRYRDWLYHSKGGNPLRMWTDDALKEGGLLDPFFSGLVGEKP